MGFSKEKTITVTADDYSTKDALYNVEYQNVEGDWCLLEVLRDNHPENPRVGMDNVWTWVTKRGAGYSDLDEDGKTRLDILPYLQMDKEEEKKWRDTVLFSDLHLYRHSGDFISIGERSSNPLCNDAWDSGVMGFAFVTKDKVLECFGVKKITRKVREKAFKHLEYEVKEINMYNAGEVYGFRFVNMTKDDEYNSWGYYCMSDDAIIQTARDFAGIPEEIAGRLIK